VDDGRNTARVKADALSGRNIGVTATPTFFIGTMTMDGTLDVASTLRGAKPIAEFRAALDALSRRK
jgi:protein-disulfide isomerase